MKKKHVVYYCDECEFLKAATFVNFFHKDDDDLDKILSDISENKNKKITFIQGVDFAWNLVLERKRKGEAVHYIHADCGVRYLY